MPKIRWTDLPPSLRQHLFDRVADRQISAEDLYKLGDQDWESIRSTIKSANGKDKAAGTT